MKRRHPYPQLWMMTDERQGDALFAAVAHMPRGAGVIFRHHATPMAERRILFDRLHALCRRRGVMLLLAGDDANARRWRADGSHHRHAGPPRIGTAPAHDLRELRAAERSGAALILISPVHATRSHPGAPALGQMRFAALMRATRTPVLALGGMDAKRGRIAIRLGAYGWAAIDAWTR
ncbi:thiamine phosphate synthase [Sphingomonas montanisoli]|uniref:Thiamine phosphate synthase n=1 Tax=Sphingomonas montanisoli TaxID=2606412 RepID=A0A5D9C4G9_9SPHN|nr:thiamine phosphate synthase [Sphingomonas montanisoli]TZG26363.1 thiamine phosphate synthase [Sphingomonas montanisoli]